METLQTLIARAGIFWRSLTDTKRGISIGVAGTVGVLLLFSWATSDSAEDRAAKLQSAIDSRGAVLSQLDGSIAANQSTIAALEADIASKQELLEGVTRQLGRAGVDLNDIELLRAQRAEMQRQVAEAEQLRLEIAELRSRREELRAQVATIDPSQVDAGITVQDFSSILDFNGWKRIFVWQTQRICYTGVSAKFCYGFERLDAQAQAHLLAARSSKQYAGMTQTKINGDNNIRQVIDWDADLLIMVGWNGDAGTHFEVTPFSQLNDDVRASLEAMRPLSQ
jgi:hypothetical protein